MIFCGCRAVGASFIKQWTPAFHLRQGYGGQVAGVTSKETAGGCFIISLNLFIFSGIIDL